MIGDHALARAADVLWRHVGWHVDGALRARLSRCVSDGARRMGIPVDAFVDMLTVDDALASELLDEVTVQESSFFRDAAQFDALITIVLPTLRPPVVVWSAGCANGQEPYSLAIALAEAGRDDARVVATDVSMAAVERTRAGRYSTRELRGLSAERLQRWFTPAGEDRVEVRDALRRRLEVRRHNLVADPPPLPSGACSVVFCRNVLIYLGRTEVRAVLERLAAWLPDDGYLFLGYSESLWHASDAFRLERARETYVYRPARSQIPRPAPEMPEHDRAVRRRAPAPAASPRRHVPAPPVDDEALPRVPALLAAGEASLAAGDVTAAVAAFRQAAYVDPRSVLAHLHLGMALEALGDGAAARRAYSGARRLLAAGPDAAVEAALEGFSAAALLAVLDDRLAEPQAGRT